MEQLQDQLESIPGFGIIQGYFDDKANDKYNSNPYEDKEGNRLKLPPQITTKQEQKNWRKIQKMAWKDDKCFLGSCGVGLDCGLGLGPLVTILPVIGPILMFFVHLRLVRFANDRIDLPADMIAKMEAGIVFDFVITLPPLLGIFLSWINSCLTRNANTIYKYMVKQATDRSSEIPVTYEGSQGYMGYNIPQCNNTSNTRNNANNQKKKNTNNMNNYKSKSEPLQISGYVGQSQPQANYPPDQQTGY